VQNEVKQLVCIQFEMVCTTLSTKTTLDLRGCFFKMKAMMTGLKTSVAI